MAKQKKWKEKYEVLSELGEGGNAKVYQVRLKESEETYALKELQTGGREKKGRFVDEINIIIENLKDYRYYCFDNADSSIARRTLGVLSLNDSTENVYKRYLIGNELHSKIDEIAELAIENEKILKTKTTMRNRIRNGCKNILKQGFPEAVYSAFMATLIFNDENFKTCMEILKRQDIWDDELEESFQKMNNNVFKIRRE